MFRFTIRELLLFTVIAALGVGWWAERRSLSARLAREAEVPDRPLSTMQTAWTSGEYTARSAATVDAPTLVSLEVAGQQFRHACGF